MFGIIRRNSVPEHQISRLDSFLNDIETFYGDVDDIIQVESLIRKIKPDEVYNLAAQSHVRISYEIPRYTAQTNAIGVLNMLEIIKNNCPDVRFYQASSSEMFGLSVDPDGFQRETTPFHPVSPYGCAKVFGFNIVRNYRSAFNLHAVNGILFNHESPRRGSNFVTNKVVRGAVAVFKGKAKTLELGNLDSYRDWGHSKDYVRAMHLMLNHSVPDDFVVSTGETYSVRSMVEYVFTKLGLDYREYVVQNPKFLRPEELPFLRGDSSKIRNLLGWKPEYNFFQIMDEMLEFNLNNS